MMFIMVIIYQLFSAIYSIFLNM